MARNVGFCISWKVFTLGALLPLLYYDRYISCFAEIATSLGRKCNPSEILEHIIHSPFFYSHQGGCTFAVTSYVIGVNSCCDSHHQSAPGGCEEAS